MNNFFEKYNKHIDLMKRFILFVVFTFVSITGMLAQTSLEGSVKDASTGEEILFGTVILYRDGVQIAGTETDLEGNYFFSDIDPGTYTLEISYVGYNTQKLTGVQVNAGQTNRVDVQLSDGVVLEGVEIKAYKVPLIQPDNTTSGATVTAENIRALPSRNIQAIAATSAGVSSVDGGAITIRGSRSSGTVYYIDGVRVQGLIPESEIEQMQVITGGVEAKYGDLVGGAISLTTKGPSSKFSGGIEAETSEGLDGYGYNLYAAHLSGPILKNKEGNSILGYRLSGRFTAVDDGRPVAGGVYRAPLSLIQQLEKDPVFSIGGTDFAALENITDVGPKVKARPNIGNQTNNFTAKIDARITDGLDVSLSGTYDNGTNQFSPSEAWGLLNWTHNPFNYSNGYRANLRIRHKLGRRGVDEELTNEEKAAKSTTLQNLYYTLQGSFEKRRSHTEDQTHKDNFFNYGYFGKQEREWVVSNGVIVDTASYVGTPVQPIEGFFFGHLGYAENEGEFIPDDKINPVLAKYNDINGYYTPATANAWQLYNNVGRVYNGYNKSENDLLSLNATLGFDFLPGGSKKGRHSIQFGMLYEQRTNRFWGISPIGLWSLARVSINNHLQGINPNKVVGQDSILLQGIPFYFDVYAPQVQERPDNKFFIKVRELTGNAIDEYVNIDGIDPNQLSINMFAANELNDAGLISYYGYDYLGNKLSGNEQFEDFFTSKDADGIRSFVTPAFKPIYAAGYLQDKFSFRDIIFRVGVRADYFDANTKVLKDPYSLYEIETAREFFDRTGQSKPSNVEDDYRVYVASEGSNSVVGFRKGDIWYKADGTAVSGGNVLFGGALVHPSIKNPNAPTIKEEGFDVNRSFKDYEPQLHFMPRLAFSFPISDEAGFFAHYDVLYQRPSGNNIQSPVGYYYFEKASSGLLNNPDLKPVRTVDYEVGFQKKLNNSSALKMSAYYKEQKDLIQSRVYAFLPAPVNSYETFGNLDFGTTKGFTFSYDRRRTGNLQINATYTLQFADGSGSDANSSRGINQRGIIRNLIPLSFDERHRLTAVLDYRYGSKNYEGPTIAGYNIFANAGINLSLTAVSGRPYTRRDVVRRFGGAGFKGAINGSRKPWSYNVDMKIDKRFQVALGTSEGARKLNITAFLRVNNLLDTRNVVNVFSFTGDPEDDGYLVSSFGQDEISSITQQNRNTEAFLAAYNWRLDSFSNFTLPRRIRLGMYVEF